MSFLPRFHSRGGGGGDSLMASGAIAQPHLVTQSSFAKSMFSSPTLSLALTNIDGLGAGEMIPADVRRRNREEEAAESRSGSENMVDGGSGEEVEGGGGGGRKKRKKRYHRHSAEQIQELEAMFKECPHPDEKQRLELSRRLSLETKQVKFWFQNRRTQMKTQLERHENTLLRQENEKLRAENMAIREAMRDPICSNCGGPAIIGEISIEEQQLRIENARLKDELDRVCALAGKFLGRAAVPVSPPLASSSCLEEYGGGGTMMMERCVYLEMGLAAMDEVVKMANEEEPLWVREKLNEEEYLRMFSGIKHINNGFVSEASRQTALVFLNTSALLDTLMDPDRWVDMFPNLVATASIADIISGGLGGTRNGALQLMHAELQILSPMVPVRQLSFLRFCKQHAEGVWAIVDVSIDPVTDTSSSPSCRRLPSGCLIHDMTNGYSKVTWVEHSEYDESYIHELYRPLIRSGLGFGAQRWIAALQRQSECLAILSTPLDHSGISANGRRNMVKLAQRMTANFCAGVCASTVYKWNKLNTRNNNVGEDVKVMTRKSVEDPGEPPGTVLSAATSVWVAAAVERVFEFLRDERLRSEWDILSNGGPMQEMLRIPKSQHRHHPNAVSLLRATSLNPNQSSMLILQETCTDASGSLVVYAPVDIPAMQAVMNGGDSAYVALLPSGFAVVPAEEDGGGGRGSLLTVAFQILVNSLPTDKLTVESVETVNNLISCTVQKIRNALRCHEPST
ncbi:homeobox-leucine zipper protein ANTHOCYANINLESS 2-like isoform X2 [Benincasa hispida]|nr:homeobox-leucine zipper protein ANTHOCYANINLESS 2-like isoform X2 [Benincasa hispida]XP_038905107.1 homeobox-leucine zipper protein ANTHOCYANINLESS 2-like isoform X2 [Benincasa hispida]